jgi:hypothetical protein
MNKPTTVKSRSSETTIKTFYLLILFLATLSGFAQMPIFKRYYIADIPMLGWLADFYITHLLHYLSAVAILALMGYRALDYLMVTRKNRKITPSGIFRVIVLCGIVVTGLFLVVYNFAGVYFTSKFVIFLDLAHLGLVMLFLFYSLYCLIFRKKWTTSS